MFKANELRAMLKASEAGDPGEKVGREDLAHPTPQPSTDARQRHLFAYNDKPHQFTLPEVDALIAAIYLHHDISLAQLVDWAECAVMDGEFAEREHEVKLVDRRPNELKSLVERWGGIVLGVNHDRSQSGDAVTRRAL